MSVDFVSIPEEMASLRQYCVRVEKRPFIWFRKTRTTFSGEWQNPKNERLTLHEALQAAQKPAVVRHEGADRPVNGIGFLVERSTPEMKKPLGGDLDCCRDPETGAISAWATKFLQKIRPFRTEVSLSKCGIRFFVWGHLPNGAGSIFCHGPQDDQPEEIKERILTAKPKARERQVKGGPVFNGLEFYEDDRHLTLTGEVLEDYCFPPEDRTEAISQAIQPIMAASWLDQVVESEKKSCRQKLPRLAILDVIDTSGFTKSGEQLFGGHPTEGSTSGRNLVIDPSRGVWAYMHNKPAKGAPGGDSWTWLACECGAVSWEQAGAGVLKDANVMRKTLEHAVERGLVSADVLGTPKADRAILDGLAEKIKTDPGIIYEPELFRVLSEIYYTDPQEWARIKKIFMTLKVSVRDFINTVKDSEDETPIIRTPFIALTGGKLAEMIAESSVARFAVYDPSTRAIEYVPEILQDGTRIIPPADDEIFQKGYVTLPSEAEEYGTELDLYQEIRAFVHKYLDVSEDYESIAAFYPMLSWVHDAMPVIAYLRAKGDWGVGKSRYLDVFRALCYRSISTTGAMSEAPIFRIMDAWKGTLIIDEGDFGKSRDSTAAMEKILVCGFERGKPIIRCNPNDPAEVNFFDPFGPKIIATRYGFRDKALESRCFTEIMKESIRTDVPIQLPREFDEEARHLRNKLLMYRFRNRELVKQTSDKGKIDIDLTGLPKRIQQAARPLSVILANYPELLATLREFLVAKSKALVLEASETTEGHIVRIIEGIEPFENDGKIITWDTSYRGLTDLIKTSSGNFKLTMQQVVSKANSLGFKTERSMIAGEQKRRITCEVPLFERLKRRYIPEVDTPISQDSAQNAQPVDELDKVDSKEGDADYSLDKQNKQEDNRTGDRENNGGGLLKRPPCPPCPPGRDNRAKLGKIDRLISSQRHICAFCGQYFDDPLVVHGHGGYICEPCRRDGAPKASHLTDHQTKLEVGA